MGFDRLSNFIIKNLNYNHGFVIDEIKRKILSNHVMFDLNFVIYNQMFELEEEINNIIKIVLNLPFSYSNGNKTEEKLQEIFDLPWWKSYCENIEFLFDGNKENEIIEKLITFINTKNADGLSKIEYMVIQKVIYQIEVILDTYHNINHLDTINFFIDGIPSFSKILEQRRRRVKNYYEAILRKEKFKTYFDNVKNLYMEIDGIKYNYFKWVNNRFSFDKSFSPISPIIKKIESEIVKYFSEKYKKIEIHLNSGANNGESDIKIFQHIQKFNFLGDIVIHTTDSDLIHSMLIQQTYHLINRKDVNISIVRHNKESEFVQLYNGISMINCILKLYGEINNKENLDYRIIYDISLFLLFFGNDHLPSSFEFGPELGIDYIFKCYAKTNTPIIDLVNDEIIINFDRFKEFLQNVLISQNNNYTKIFLTRNFKLSPNITNFLIDKYKMNLSFNEILDLFKLLLIENGLSIKDQLDEDDLRYKLINKNPDIKEIHLLNFMNKYSNQIREEFNNIKEQILDNLDVEMDEYFGLPSYVKPYAKSNDNYQDLYNILTENTLNELNQKNSLLSEPNKEDYLKFNNQEYKQEMCDNYLKKIYHICKTHFGNLKNYHTNNITSYVYNSIPRIDYLIKYIQENHNYSKWDTEIKNDDLEEDKYFNCINHHIYITPYLRLDDIKDDAIKNTAKSLKIDNLWTENKEIENFEHNKVNPQDFLKEWDNIIKESEIPTNIYMDKIPDILSETSIF